MRTIKLKIAYDGSRYQGYQKQPHGNTIQNILEEFLNKVCGEPVTAKGSGRTDAGVHALGQIVSVNTNGKIPCKNLVRASKAGSSSSNLAFNCTPDDDVNVIVPLNTPLSLCDVFKLFTYTIT